MSNGRLSENAILIATNRYFMEGEDWESCANRVGKSAAVAENSHMYKYTEKFSEIIFNLDFLPGGRILRNSGRQAGSLFNCYHLPIGDSREEIGQLYKDSLILWGEGGGVGVNMSSLRPKGATIKKVGGVSSGPVSFLEADDAIAECIESGGSRRAAALASMHVSHPDIIRFIDAKLTKPDVLKWLKKDTPEEIKQFVKDKIEKEALSHFNISVCVNDEFLEAVESNDEWEFKFAHQSYGKIKAKELWNKIIENMVKHAEPGLLNWDNLTKNNSYYYDPVCISGDTLISTTEGLMPVRELDDKEFDVISDLRVLYSKGAYVEKAHAFKTGEREVFEVKLSNNQSIKLTEDHRVWTNVGWKKVNQLIEKKDYLYVQNAVSPHFVNNLNDNYSYDNGFLLGLLVGDGWIHVDKNVVQYGFVFNENESELMEFVGKRINDIAKESDMYREINWRPSSGGSKSFEITTTNKNVKKYFSKWGYSSVTNKYGYMGGSRRSSKFISDEVLQETPSFKQGFIAGLFAADGSIERVGRGSTGNGKRITLSTSKRDIAKLVQLMLNEFGIPSSIGSGIVNFNGKTFTVHRVNISRMESCAAFRRLIPIKYGDKGSILEEHVSDFGTKWNEKFYGMFKVKSIKRVGLEEVYDITTDVTHSFIANGISIHNCGTNPCGEAVLAPYDVCDLGSLPLPNFITGNINTNWKKLGEVIKLAVRFLDDVIDVNKYVLQEIDIKAHNSRRIGLGIMGLAEYLFAKRLKYGSNKAINEIERLMRFIRDSVYETLVELAVEKGAFPKFDPVAYGKASFIRKLPASLRMDIKENGVRCVTGMAIAPTGTISLLADVTSGIEPLFRKAYLRSDRVSDRMYVHPIYEKLLESKDEVPEWFVDSDDLEPSDHFETQAVVQRYVDGAVSKCISLDSKVLTDNGYIELKDFSDNREENVFSGLNTDFCVFTEGKSIKPTSFYYNGVVNGKHIETKNGFNLDGSNIHRIKVLSKDHNEIWKRMDELVVGDVAIIPLNTCIVDSSKNSYIDNNYEKSGRYVKDVELPNKVTKDLCWWLGCLVADGHVVDGSYEIGITQSLNKSNDVINKFKNVSKKLFGVEFDVMLDKRHDNLYNIYFNSIKLYDWLVRGLKFSKENIPSIILSSGKLMKRAFIEGLTLDGFVTEDNHICLKTDKSENLIQQLQLLCCEIGIPTYITTKFDAKYNKFYYNLFIQSDGIGCLKNFVFTEPFKQNRFEVILNKNKYVRRNVFMFNGGNIPINNDFLNKISDIEKQVINSPKLYNVFHHIYNNAKQHMYLSLDAIMTVYSFIGEVPTVFNNKYLLSEISCVSNIEIETADIEIPYTHNYIANGFISHNTINMPKGTTPDQLSKLTLEYIHDLKGVTVYVDGSRKGQILNKVTEDEVNKYLSENKTKGGADVESVQCASGACEL